eukprot:5155960-Pleurochrysis_carterae.AAC.1
MPPRKLQSCFTRRGCVLCSFPDAARWPISHVAPDRIRRDPPAALYTSFEAEQVAPAKSLLSVSRLAITVNQSFEVNLESAKCTFEHLLIAVQTVCHQDVRVCQVLLQRGAQWLLLVCSCPSSQCSCEWLRLAFSRVRPCTLHAASASRSSLTRIPMKSVLCSPLLVEMEVSKASSARRIHAVARQLASPRLRTLSHARAQKNRKRARIHTGALVNTLTRTQRSLDGRIHVRSASGKALIPGLESVREPTRPRALSDQRNHAPTLSGNHGPILFCCDMSAQVAQQDPRRAQPPRGGHAHARQRVDVGAADGGGVAVRRARRAAGARPRRG